MDHTRVMSDILALQAATASGHFSSTDAHQNMVLLTLPPSTCDAHFLDFVLLLSMCPQPTQERLSNYQIYSLTCTRARMQPGQVTVDARSKFPNPKRLAIEGMRPRQLEPGKRERGTPPEILEGFHNRWESPRLDSSPPAAASLSICDVAIATKSSLTHVSSPAYTPIA